MSSGIGPACVRCLKCDAEVATDRTEWEEMSGEQEMGYLFMTVVYMAIVGLMAGNFLDEAYQLWESSPQIEHFQFHSCVFQYSALVGAACVLFLQIFRIQASKRRPLTPFRITPFDCFVGPHWNLNWKILILLIAIWGVAKIRYEMM